MLKKLDFICLLIIYMLVPIIILIMPTLYNYKFIILTIIGILIFIYLRYKKISFKDMGISKLNILKSIIANLSIILLSVLIITLLIVLGMNEYNSNENIIFYLFYVFISCPIQEFLYRSVFYIFERTLNKNMLIVSSICYSFVHIIYKDILTLILTFIIGLIWYYLYRKDKNIVGVIISHIIIGILTISLGIVN